MTRHSLPAASRNHRLRLLALLGALLTSLAGSEVLIDNFDGRSVITPWVFSNGPEFPGATGSLAIISDGHSGNAARLSIDDTAGGAYVAGSYTFPTPLAISGLSFWLRASPELSVAVRIHDTTGQTLQYGSAFRPMELLGAYTPWYRVNVDVADSTSHWGGANDGVFHGPATSISILVEPRKWNGNKLVLTGFIDVDEVTAITTPEVPVVDPAGPVAAIPTAGAFTDGLGVNIHFTSDDQALNAIRGAGFTWVRMDLAWSRVETVLGTYNFANYDSLISSLEARGLKALFIIDYGNALYANASPPSTDAARAAFAAYAEACARHFAGHGCLYEIWNEPDIAGTNWPTPDPVQYAALFQAALAGVRRGDPTATVSTGGTGGMDRNFLRDAMASNGLAGANAVAVHPYRQGGPESTTDDLVMIRKLVSDTYPTQTPPVWSGEWGYSSTWYGDGSLPASRDVQAHYAARELLTTWLLGFPMRIYYDIRDDGTDPLNKEHNFGLLDNAYVPKPAMLSVQTLISVMAGRRLSGVYQFTVPDLYAVRLLGANDILTVVWRQVGSTTVTFPQTPVRVWDEHGADLTWTSLGGTSTSVSVGTSLVYAFFHRPAMPPLPTASTTNPQRPTLSGTAEANAVVNIYDNGTLVGTVSATAGGNWSWTPSADLSVGTHQFTVTATSADGNVSDASTPLSVAVAAPPTPTPAATSGSGGHGCGSGSALGLLMLAVGLFWRLSIRWR